MAAAFLSCTAFAPSSAAEIASATLQRVTAVLSTSAPVCAAGRRVRLAIQFAFAVAAAAVYPWRRVGDRVRSLPHQFVGKVALIWERKAGPEDPRLAGSVAHLRAQTLARLS